MHISALLLAFVAGCCCPVPCPRPEPQPEPTASAPPKAALAELAGNSARHGIDR